MRSGTTYRIRFQGERDQTSQLDLRMRASPQDGGPGHAAFSCFKGLEIRQLDVNLFKSIKSI